MAQKYKEKNYNFSYVIWNNKSYYDNIYLFFEKIRSSHFNHVVFIYVIKFRGGNIMVKAVDCGLEICIYQPLGTGRIRHKVNF